jgi:hypothetical protein
MKNKFKKREKLNDQIEVNSEILEDEEDFFNKIDDILNGNK